MGTCLCIHTCVCAYFNVTMCSCLCFHSIRRLSYSKNGVIRIDGFSSPDQYDDEAVSLWAPDMYEENELDLETSKYILSFIGDKFCQLVVTENMAATWIKKDGMICFSV